MADEVVPLKEYFERIISERDLRTEQRFASQETATKAAMASASEAVRKAETASDARFASVNEFRAALTDQARDFATKDLVEKQFKTVTDRLDKIYTRQTLQDGSRSGLSAGWAYIVGGLGIVGAVISVIVQFRH